MKSRRKYFRADYLNIILCRSYSEIQIYLKDLLFEKLYRIGIIPVYAIQKTGIVICDVDTFK